MIVISDNDSMIDETKIISVISTGYRSIEITLDNGHDFHRLEFSYGSEQTKNRYLNKIKTVLEAKDSLLKYEEVHRYDCNKDNASVYIDSKLKYDELLDGEIVILKRRKIY